jgi:predicted nucleotidyltransferase
MSNNHKILADLKKLLKKNFGNLIKEVILFGSQSNNTNNNYSDYDILLIVNEKFDFRKENEIFDVCYEINLNYNILIDLHILAVDELDKPRGKQPIFTKAIEEGLYA